LPYSRQFRDTLRACRTDCAGVKGALAPDEPGEEIDRQTLSPGRSLDDPAEQRVIGCGRGPVRQCRSRRRGRECGDKKGADAPGPWCGFCRFPFPSNQKPAGSHASRYGSEASARSGLMLQGFPAGPPCNRKRDGIPMLESSRPRPSRSLGPCARALCSTKRPAAPRPSRLPCQPG